MGLSALWATLLLLACPSIASAQGPTAFDPATEHVLIGKNAPALEALVLGQWDIVPDRLALRESDPGKNNYWIPTGDVATLRDGFVRARIEVGTNLDASVLFRAQAPPDDIPGFSGYGLSLVGDELSFLRWDQGVVRTVGEETKLKKLRKVKTIEVTLWAIGPHITAVIYDGDSMEHLHTLVMSDTTYRDGQVGYRAYLKQDPDTALTLFSVRKAGAETGSLRSPVGSKRFAIVPTDQLERIPRHLKVQVIEERGEGDRTLIGTNRVGLERLKRAGVDVLSLEPEATFRYVDKDYRRYRGQPPEATDDGFRLDLSYKDPEMVEALMRGYHERYPGITRLVELGTTHGGRPILALKISDNPDESENEPAVLLNGGHHGVEFIATEFVLDAMHTLLASYKTDRRVRKWVKRAEIWCVPLVNPDGNDAHMNTSYMAGRKNGRDLDRDGRFDPAEGVDPNRNYPFRWHSLGEAGSNSRSAHKWYRGPEPGSEPETQAMMRLADAEHFVASISYHTWGTVILAPYTIDNVQNPEPNEAWTIAEEIAAAVDIQSNGRKYRVQRNIYSVDGVDQDWFRAAHGTVALLIEGAYHNPRSPEKRALTIERNRETWMQLLDRVLAGPTVYGTVRDAAGNPLVARVSIVEMPTAEGEVWTSRCRDGRFERMLPAPGPYTVRVELPGQPAFEELVNVRAGERERVDVVLDPPSATLDELLCSVPEMCAAETVCRAKQGGCVEPGPPSSCRIDGSCVAAGAAAGGGCATCDPKLALEWTPTAPGAVCGDAVCRAGVLHGQGSCDGEGACTLQSETPCAPYAMCVDSTQCATGCLADKDCVDGFSCDAGACVSRVATADSGHEDEAARAVTKVSPPPKEEEQTAGCSMMALHPRAAASATELAFVCLVGVGLLRTRRQS